MDDDELRSIQIRHVASGLLTGLDEAGSEADQLNSLMEVLVCHLDDVRIDPQRTIRVAANVGRIAHDMTARLACRMIAAEERAAALEVIRQRAG